MTNHTHEQCPYCEHDECYSEDDETGVFFCFSCGAKPSGIPNNKRKYLYYDNSEEESGVSLETYVKDNYRGISRQVLEKFGVYFTKNNGKETVHYKYKNGTKHRGLPKSITISGKVDHFYGQEDYNGGGKTLTITEGEEDRLSVIQMMGDYPCVSVPNASPSKDFWKNAQEYLQGWEQIKLSIDNDHAGNKLSDKFATLFPGKVYRVPHTKYKDANDFLNSGAKEEYKRAWWNAQRIKPDNILCTKEDLIRLYEHTPNYEYCPTGIDELDEKILGLHKGALTIIVAPTGLGKTEVMRYLEYQVLSSSNYSIAACHLEETPLRSVLGLVSYQLGKNLTRKDLVEKAGMENDVYKAMEDLTKGERYYYFNMTTHEGPDDLIDKIRFLVTAMGVDYVFFEPVQDVVTGNVSDKESILSDLSNKLKRLAPELNVGIIVVAHANDEGDTKYCKTIAQSASFEIRLERDMNAETELERNRTYVSVGRKNRVGGGSGPAGTLLFDNETYMLTPEVSFKDMSNETEVGF
jgi:KaiC/GvpD/RAD55 family RecA-like ATPase